MDTIKKKLEEDARKIVQFSNSRPYLRDAFYHVMGKRIIEQGYVDGGYILRTSVRGTYYSKLKDSRLQPLFAKGCVAAENVEVMIEYLKNMLGVQEELQPLEEEALVFWIFLPYLSAARHEKRAIYMLAILQNLLNYYKTKEWHLAITNGIVFDKDVCAVEIETSVGQYMDDIFDLKKGFHKNVLFYRGHSCINYFLQPGIKREQCWLENENVMYQELLVRCPQNFVHCQTHLEYLVEMQHYGLPTRLLDITENPLVALYFACISNKEKPGEVFVLCEKPENVKYAKSDTAAILAALPTLHYHEQRRLHKLCGNGKTEKEDEEYSALAGKLASEVKSRNPAFEPRILKKDLLGYVFVTPARSNQRIVKQEGSFIVCGLGAGESLDRLRFCDNEGKKMVFVITEKEKILKELDMLSVNRASLFPEIDDVAEYIREKYQS